MDTSIVPRVSIIIPAYNRANFLGEAVASALAQTYRDFEVIVVDDGSTDNTPELVSRFPAVVRYMRQENQGECAARNTGIKAARGEYIAFLDSDDLLMENAIEKGVAFLDKYPEAGFSYGQVYYIDEKGRLLKWKKVRGAKAPCVRDGKEEIAILSFRGDIAVDAVMARRSCFDEVGLFNPVLHVGGDIDMWLRLSMKYAVGYIPESLGKVRVHPQNVTSQRSFEVLKSSQTAFIERALEGLKSAPDYHFLKRKAYFGLYCYLAEECARGGHLAKGFRYALKALITCPELLLNVEGISFFMVVARGFLPREFRGIGKRALMAVGLR